MKNKYYIMRHGESEANVQKLIVGNPINGVPSYGLSIKGKEGALNSIKGNKIELGSDILIFSSDFKRARETAEIVSKYLGELPIIFREELRERQFGSLEKTSNENYKIVWDEDVKDPSHKLHGSESILDVLKRAKSMIDYCEENHENKKILFVSHGDTMQILMAYYLGLNPETHRSIKSLETAEIRELISSK